MDYQSKMINPLSRPKHQTGVIQVDLSSAIKTDYVKSKHFSFIGKCVSKLVSKHSLWITQNVLGVRLNLSSTVVEENGERAGKVEREATKREKNYSRRG